MGLMIVIALIIWVIILVGIYMGQYCVLQPEPHCRCGHAKRDHRRFSNLLLYCELCHDCSNYREVKP